MSNTASQPFIRQKDLPSEVVPVLIDVVTAAGWERYAQTLTEAQRVFAEERKFTSIGKIQSAFFGSG